jgi:hypothetical protein
MLVLRVGRPEALELVGVRDAAAAADDVIFVVRRGCVNDMLGGSVYGGMEEGLNHWDLISLALVVTPFMQSVSVWERECVCACVFFLLPPPPLSSS